MNPLEGALHPARFQQHFQSNQGLTLWDIFRAYVVGRVRGPCWCKVESARAGSLPSSLPTALPVKTGVHIVGHFPGLCRKTGLRPMLWDVFGAHGAARFRGAWCAASSGACRGTCSGLMLWDVVATRWTDMTHPHASSVMQSKFTGLSMWQTFVSLYLWTDMTHPDASSVMQSNFTGLAV